MCVKEKRIEIDGTSAGNQTARIKVFNRDEFNRCIRNILAEVVLKGRNIDRVLDEYWKMYGTEVK